MVEQAVRIQAEGHLVLEGDLTVPEHAAGIVVFAHGSGSSRFSPRNRRVAGALQSRSMATLLMDLLSPEEEADDLAGGHLRFDVGLLARRLVVAIDWLGNRPGLIGLPVGLFGASTGAAAALAAAVERKDRVAAVVSRGGRPDLAAGALEAVTAPTLLIVGGRDEVVVGLNRQAYSRLGAPRRLEVVPGATHLFEEPGALEEVGRLAAAWFEWHFGPDTEAPREVLQHRRRQG